MNARFGVAVFVALLLGGAALAAQLEIPDPPRMPQALQPLSTANALQATRDALLARKQAWLADVAAFNRAAAHEVSEAEAVRLQEWQKRLLARRADYLKEIEALKQNIIAVPAGTKLAELRKQVRETQESLRRLQRQSALTSAELDHWRAVTEKTVDHAQDMLVDMLADALLSLPVGRLEGTYKEIEGSLSQELQRAASLIAGETDPARGKRLQTAFQLLNHQRDTIRRIQQLLGNLKQAREAKALDDLNQLPAAQQFKTGMQELLLVAGEKKLQESLQSDFGFSFPVMTKLAKGVEGYRYAEKVVDAAYDVTAVSIAWKRIHQQNATAELLLEAVDRLGERMETLVDAIKEIQSTLPTR